jgi:RNA polymerase sporulation-specific sigma factor
MQTRAATLHRRPYRGDEESALIVAAQAGDESASTALMSKYRSFVRCKARSYFLAGADRDDVVQEGMIGLYKAIRDFKFERRSSFRSFAELCITRQLITAIKTAKRQKHTPLNTYVSLNRSASVEDEGERILSDILAAREICDPAELVISEWEAGDIQRGFAEVLSPLESEVLRLYMDGKSYQEIAGSLERHVKSIDNALQRVKRKIECQMRSYQEC